MYVPLHNHSEYSFFDGYQHPEEMARRAKEIGAEAIALTDHGTLNGIVRFVDACSEAGVRPILGNELYWTPDMHNKSKDTPTHHLVLWAATDEGYRNLLSLTSLGQLEGAFGPNQRPRIDDEAIRKYSKGLIASSSCLNGKIPELLLAGSMEEAEEIAGEYARIFDHFVLEIQPQEIPDQYRLNALIVELAERTGLPLIVTTDSHYAVREDAPYQDLMLAIQTRDELHDPDRFRMHGETYWIKTEEEIRETLLWDRGNGPERMPDSLIDEALRGTIAVANRCQAKLELGRNRMPAYPTEGETEQELLVQKAYTGLLERLVENEIMDVATYQERLQNELDVILSKGYAGYFLIVSDIVQWGKKQGIPFGPSRGSAGGSLLAWALRITEIDPIRFDLIFERFLNPERESPPDIDIDVADDRRGELIEYIRSRYGDDHVAQIGTVGTMAVKDAFKRVCKAYGISFQEANKLSTRITASSLDEEADPAVREFLRTHPEIHEGAKRVQDRAISRGIHAAGVAIAPDAIVGHTALQRGKNGETVTQADMHDIERLGLLKIDVLGLKTLSVLDHAMRLANNPGLTWESLMAVDVDDSDIYKLIRAGRTESIFQIESSLMKKLIEEVRPSTFEDLVAILSLGRPGPMAMIPTYSARKHGREPVEYLHPKLEQILKNTYGIFVYQEQAIRAATDLAGYSLGQADLLRRAIGKKKADVMEAEHERFLRGCQEYSGISPETAKKIWDQIEAFANYGFNRCVTGDTLVTRASGNQYDGGPDLRVDKLYDRWNSRAPVGQKYRDPKRGVSILALDSDGRIRPKRVKGVYRNGIKPVYRVTTDDGRSIKATANHPFLTSMGEWVLLEDLTPGMQVIVSDGYEKTTEDESKAWRLSGKPQINSNESVPGRCGFQRGEQNPGYINGAWISFKQRKEELFTEGLFCRRCGTTFDEIGDRSPLEVHHLDGDHSNNASENLTLYCISCHKKAHYEMGRTKRWERGHAATAATIVAIEPCGEEMTYDIEMDTDLHNFVANGFVVHNSHAVGYAVISVWTILVKLRAPAAFWTAVLSNEVSSNAKDRDEKVQLYASMARKDHVDFLPPDVNRSDWVFTLDDGKIRWGLSGIKGVGQRAVEAIMEARPYQSLDDFLARINRTLVKKDVLRSLAYSGALDGLGEGADRGAIWNKILSWRKANKMPVKEEDWQQGDFDRDELIRYEHELLGVSVTSLTDWEKASDGSYIEISGKITKIRKHTDKRGNQMAFAQLETKHGELVDLVVFARTYGEGGVKKLLKADKEVTVAGSKNGNSLIMQEIGPQGKRLKDDGPTILVDQAPLFGPLL